jgi:hypothetical protein
MAKVFAWLAFCLSALPSRKHGRNQTVRDGAISWTHSKSTLSNGRVFCILGDGAERDRVAKPVMMFAKRAPQDAQNALNL